jgi:hypothetical protein
MSQKNRRLALTLAADGANGRTPISVLTRTADQYQAWLEEGTWWGRRKKRALARKQARAEKREVKKAQSEIERLSSIAEEMRRPKKDAENFASEQANQ